MKLYEFQAKQFFSQRKIPIPEGTVCETPEEARLAYEKMGGSVVLKSQVLVGGRGKAGGIKFPESPDEAYQMTSELLSRPLKGVQVEKVLLERKLDMTALMVSLIEDYPESVARLSAASGHHGIDLLNYR